MKFTSIAALLLVDTVASYQASGLPKGFALTITTDIDKYPGLMIFDVECPSNTWLGLTFGRGMSNKDMVRFVCNSQGSVEDLYSSGYR